MKTAVAAIAFASALVARTASAIEYTVASCAELADVDDDAITSLTITSSIFECEAYTRFRVRNSMTLKATVPEVHFSNFCLKVLGDLVVEPDVVFTGVYREVKNGGALNVQEGSTVTFMGTANYTGNSVYEKTLTPPSCGERCYTIGKGLSYIATKGGAIHNKGTLTFEGDATFVNNEARTGEFEHFGYGGAISNTAKGYIHFKGKLTMEGNYVDGGYAGPGGAIYTRGDVVADGESFFTDNRAQDGGAIYLRPWANVEFNDFATFTGNSATNIWGGAVGNWGGNLDVNAGSLFEDNGAYGSGDGGFGGAIYNRDGGVITLTGSTTFRANEALEGGAIYYDSESSTTTYPDNTVFEDNEAYSTDGFCPNVWAGDQNCEA